MLTTMTASSIGLIPPMNSSLTASGDDPSDERRRARRIRVYEEMGRLLVECRGAEHDRRRPESQRPCRVRGSREMN